MDQKFLESYGCTIHANSMGNSNNHHLASSQSELQWWFLAAILCSWSVYSNSVPWRLTYVWEASWSRLALAKIWKTGAPVGPSGIVIDVVYGWITLTRVSYINFVIWISLRGCRGFIGVCVLLWKVVSYPILVESGWAYCDGIRLWKVQHLKTEVGSPITIGIFLKPKQTLPCVLVTSGKFITACSFLRRRFGALRNGLYKASKDWHSG